MQLIYLVIKFTFNFSLYFIIFWWYKTSILFTVILYYVPTLSVRFQINMLILSNFICFIVSHYMLFWDYLIKLDLRCIIYMILWHIKTTAYQHSACHYIRIMVTTHLTLTTVHTTYHVACITCLYNIKCMILYLFDRSSDRLIAQNYRLQHHLPYR